MPTEVSKKQEAQLKAKAKEADSKIRRLASEILTKPWEVARIAAEVKRGQLFKYMGHAYPTIEEWRVDVGIKRSTFFRGVRLYDGLRADVPWKVLRTISMENSEWLLKLPQDQRSKPEMWEKARTMNEDEFIEVVNDRRRKNGETPEDGRVTFKVRMYANAADVVKSAIERFIEDHNLNADDPGRALELLAADYLATSKSGGKSFVAKLGERITGAAFELTQLQSIVTGLRAEFDGKSNKSGDEILLAVAKQLDPIEEGIVKAVQALAAATKNMASRQPKGTQQVITAPPLEAARAAAAAGTSSKVN